MPDGGQVEGNGGKKEEKNFKWSFQTVPLTIHLILDSTLTGPTQRTLPALRHDIGNTLGMIQCSTD